MQWTVVVLSFIIYIVEILCENKTADNIEFENKLAVLGYIQGYKIGRNTALKYPGFLLSPIIVIPAVNRQQHVNSNIKVQNSSAVIGKILLDDDNDIEVSFRQALERGSGNKTKIQQNLNQTDTIEKIEMSNNDAVKNTTISEIIPHDNTTTKENDSKETSTKSDITTETHGPYPNAVYNNSAINSLTITIKAPDEVLIPPLANDQWENFTVSTNTSLKGNATKQESTDSLNITRYPSVNETDSPIKGVYPTALYNNAEIDQLSITTNSYTNRSPLLPPQDDRWSTFASLRKNSPLSNEFRPLAGLYYDGFLHRPILKTQGFVPYNHYQ